MLLKNKGLIISTIESSGRTQMDLDLYFLNQTINCEEIMFTLRFYIWSDYWLSIGYHQKQLPKKWLNLEKDGLIKIIKRPSGGGAVLHSGGITYALTFKKPLYKKMSYQLVNEWLVTTFSKLGLVLSQGNIKKSFIQNNCFGSNFTSDLVDQNGHKRIGSAQLWRKGSFLQHGEILLNPPTELWFKIFGEECPPQVKFSLDKKEIIYELKHSFLKNYSDPSIENVFISCEDIKQLNLRNYL